jgi:hypothetical protein
MHGYYLAAFIVPQPKSRPPHAESVVADRSRSREISAENSISDLATLSGALQLKGNGSPTFQVFDQTGQPGKNLLETGREQ